VYFFFQISSNRLPTETLQAVRIERVRYGLVRHEDAIDQDFGSAPEDFLIKWSGYAGTKINIALRKFQVQALTALHFSRDIIIVDVTDSGNSTCFQLPALMLKDEEFCYLLLH
jgi:ATP-dependent helicase YprA (DUF1998 family)